MFSRFILSSLLAFSAAQLCANPPIDSSHPAEIDLSQLEAKTKHVNYEKQLWVKPIQKTKRPYWAPSAAIEAKGSIFFQPSVGLGILYFRNVNGNFSITPNTFSADEILTPSLPFKRGLSYNRTLLKDYQWGYRFFDWFKVALSYQNQSGMFLFTQPFPYQRDDDDDQPAEHIQQSAYFSLNALQIKAYLELPYTFIYKKIALTPFGGIGFGPGWQTWFPEKHLSFDPSNNFQYIFNPKIIPNFTFVLDKGFRVQPAVVNPSFSTLVGLKFMYWGQARNIGQFEQQGPLKTGNFKPFRIKSIYSFAPYLGFQWNFPATRGDYARSKKIYASETDTFFIHQKYTIAPPKVFAQFNVGPNFLYFSGIRGNLTTTPAEYTDASFVSQNYDQKFKYNRVPLYEYLIGTRLSKTFQFALSFQTSSYNVLQSPYINSGIFTVDDDDDDITIKTLVNFKSYLNLYALMAKAYIYFPYAFKAGFVSMNYYCSLGFGPSWQSWYSAETNNPVSFRAVTFGLSNLSFHPKTIANASMMVDMGFDIKNPHPDSLFHIYTGIRFNLWGQVRNLGKASQQPYQPSGLFSPLRVKTLYSFTPYVSFQWDFSVSKNGEYVDKQYTNTWTPFVVKSLDFERPSFLFFQANLGPNFLRFAGVQGDLSVRPAPSTPTANFTSPYKGRISKNNSLLYEFLLGYQAKTWLTAALSIQSQTGLYLVTKAIPEFGNNVGLSRSTAQLQSQVQMYSVMFKPTIIWPKALILKNWAWSPYLGVGVGPGWQSWNNIRLRRTNNIVSVESEEPSERFFDQSFLPLRSKTSASVSWMIDAGLKTRNVSPLFNASIVIGCKYNQWGQVLNVGKLAQQWPLRRVGLTSPFTVKTVYSWAPYVGFQWNF